MKSPSPHPPDPRAIITAATLNHDPLFETRSLIGMKVSPDSCEWRVASHYESNEWLVASG